MPKKRPTEAELLGYRQVTGKNMVGNLDVVISPAAKREEGRFDSMDQFSPESESKGGQDNEYEWDEDCDDEATPEAEEESAFLNTQHSPLDDMPGIEDPTRFTAQNKEKRREG